MKEAYHFSFSSHEEVLFRCPEDVGYFVSQLAIRAAMHGVEVLADAEMSDHSHGIVAASRLTPFVGALRESHTKYLNRKYGRSGRMGDFGFFFRKLQGPVQIQTAISYTLRNGVHHGVSGTPYEYRYSSANEMFANQRGVVVPVGSPLTAEWLKQLPRYTRVPEELRIGEDGIILRSSFMEIAQAESYYVTPRNFFFQMNRISDERWENDQQREDPLHPPLKLADMEPGFDAAAVSKMLASEKGWKYDPARLTDFGVCALIDKQMLGRYRKGSVYLLSEKQKQALFNELYHDAHLPAKQIKRCLAMGR